MLNDFDSPFDITVDLAELKKHPKNLVVSSKNLIFAANNLEYYDYGNIGTR